MNTNKLFESYMINLNESIDNSNYVIFNSEDEIKSEFTNPDIFTEDKIEYIGTDTPGNCKKNSFDAYISMPEENKGVYKGYIVLKDKDSKLGGIRHYWNGDSEMAIEHTAVRDTKLYNSGELLYYIGEKIK